MATNTRYKMAQASINLKFKPIRKKANQSTFRDILVRFG